MDASPSLGSWQSVALNDVDREELEDQLEVLAFAVGFVHDFAASNLHE